VRQVTRDRLVTMLYLLLSAASGGFFVVLSLTIGGHPAVIWVVVAIAGIVLTALNSFNVGRITERRRSLSTWRETVRPDDLQRLTR
jgi:hypothetical protein